MINKSANAMANIQISQLDDSPTKHIKSSILRKKKLKQQTRDMLSQAMGRIENSHNSRGLV